MGKESAETPDLAIECPNNLNQTFFEHGLGGGLLIRKIKPLSKWRKEE